MLQNISDQSKFAAATNQAKYEFFVDFIMENKDKFYRLAFCYAKTSDGAMDIVQDAIAKALKNIGSLREPAYIKTWFYRIVVNESLQYLRSNKKLVAVEDGFATNDTDFEGEDNLSCTKLDLYKAISNLTPKLKTVIVLRYFEDCKIQEIAKITNTNENTVKSRLRLALEQLQKCYKKEV
ncbi:MAG: sigma-70 family RNA polymerase sigma factor [Clostridia bacterium]|nr:sigma-70 family RNA polymerase sigma factor [Clostridia bacterium]